MLDIVDVGTLRGLGTALVLLAFLALTCWAYSAKRQRAFEEAAYLPFADDAQPDDLRTSL